MAWPKGVPRTPKPQQEHDDVSDGATGLEAGQARMAERRAAEEAAALAALANTTPDGHRTAPGITRDTRKPFGAMEQKLFWPKRAGYHRHWFNDTPGRIDAALGAGYAHVQGRDEKPVCRVVGKREGGGGLMAYLMEIPEEWFQEDMARAQKIVDETRNDIYRGNLGSAGLKEKERYTPRQGVSIRETDASR